MVVTHDGTMGQAIYSLDCDNLTDLLVSPTTFATDLTATTKSYTFEGTCDYINPDTYSISATVENEGGDWSENDTVNVVVAADTEPEGTVAFGGVGASVLPATCTAPCTSQVVSLLAYNGDTSYTFKGDLDTTCTTATTDCADPCWETTVPDTDGLALSEPITLTDTSPGIKTLRFCVLDERPSSAFVTDTVTVESAAQDIVITALADPNDSAVSPLNNVALEVDCNGGTCDDGCDVTFDCDIAVSGGSTTLMTNTFNTTGAQGCDDATSSTGTTSCSGGVAQAGTGASTTNAIFFHNQYTSATEQYITLDDLTIITDSGNVNQNRFNLRDDATSKYVLQTASPSTNSLRLTCPGNSCTTAASQYVDGTPFDVVLHVINTATGLAAIETTGGTNLCTCTGNAAGEVDGFVVNGGQAVISISGVTVTTPGAASDPTALVDNTTWPFNTQTDAAQNCDGYTTGTSTARVTTACPDAEVSIIDIPIQVTAAPTFSIDSITTNIGTTATYPNCIIDELTITYSGSAINTVSAIGATMSTGGSAEVLTTTTDAASPFAYAATGGWAGHEYDTDGTYTITVTATREGITATRQMTFQCLPEPTQVTALLMSPATITRNVPTGNDVPASETITVTEATGTSIPFSCIENPPSDKFSLSSCCDDTPATLTVTPTNFPAAGTFCTDIECASDDDSTVSAETRVCYTAATPTGNTPAWTAGKDASGNLLVYTGKIGASSTISIRPGYDNKPGTSAQTFFNSEDTGSTSADSHVLRNSHLRRTSLNNGQPDVMNITVGNGRDSKYWLLKNITAERAYMTITGPHADVLQAFGLITGQGDHFVYEGIFIQNSILRDSDSGQIFWNTTMMDEGADQFLWYVLQDNYMGTSSAGVTECNARAATACTGSSCTFNCAGKRINLAGNSTSTTHPARWVINVEGKPHFEGSAPPNPPNTKPLIMIPPANAAEVYSGSGAYCGYDLSGAAGQTNRFCYTSIEAALAAGQAEPPFIRLSCGGWANPGVNAPNCISGYGYVPSAQ